MYVVTAVWSLFAYIWLMLVLLVISPDVVRVWEACVTLMFFPILVIMSYYADKGVFDRFGYTRVAPRRESTVAPGTKVRVSARAQKDRKLQVGSIEKLVRGTAPAEEDHRNARLPELSRAQYRKLAIQSMFGRPDEAPMLSEELAVAVHQGRIDTAHTTTLGFAHARHSFVDTIGEATIAVERAGSLAFAVEVGYSTADDTAVAPADFTATRGTLTFAVGVSSAVIRVAIRARVVVDAQDDGSLAKRRFRLMLEAPRVFDQDATAVLSRGTCSMFPVSPAGGPGTLSLEYDSFRVLESSGKVVIRVLRHGAAKGRVGVRYKTADGTAVAPADYIAAEGELIFLDGQCEASFEVAVVDDDVFERDEHFWVELTDPRGGAECGGVVKAKVTIVNDDEVKGVRDKVTKALAFNADRLKLARETWAEQFKEATAWPSNGSALVRVLHCLTVPWKVLVACIPPCAFCGGYLAFGTSLVLIGLTTALIGDFASLFGCVVGLNDAITAITVVALGTSLPDLFASKMAAVHDRTADAAITNITGSNSVNVFLGLGLAWLAGSCKWEAGSAPGPGSKWIATVPADIAQEYPGGVFYVRGGDLGFSVGTFIGCAVCTMALLHWQRTSSGGELGGPRGKLTAGLLFILWLTYVILSSLKVEGHI